MAYQKALHRQVDFEKGIFQTQKKKFEDKHLGGFDRAFPKEVERSY